MKVLLQEIIDRLPGALGVAVVGLDGVPVEQVASDQDFSIELASAEGMGIVLRAVSTEPGVGGEPLEEITVSRPKRLTILRALGPDYFLCLVVGPESPPGRARFEAWRAGLQLREAVR